MVVYSLGAVVVANKSHRQRNSSLTKIDMNVDVIFKFGWIRWYEASRSIFPTRIRFYGHLKHMYAVMWKMQRKQKP